MSPPLRPTRRRTDREKVLLLRAALLPFSRAFRTMPEPVQQSLERPMSELAGDYGLRVCHFRDALMALEETDGES